MSQPSTVSRTAWIRMSGWSKGTVMVAEPSRLVEVIGLAMQTGGLVVFWSVFVVVVGAGGRAPLE